VTIVLVWIWLNPRLFAQSSRLETWAAHAVLGERIWLRQAARVARHHLRAGRALTAISALGMLPFAWGLWVHDP